MEYRFQYSDETERASILSENKDKQLIEDQMLISGNFLIFADPSPTDLEIAELKRQNADLMVAMAELAAIITAGGGTA